VTLGRITLVALGNERAGTRHAVSEFRRRIETELLDRGGGGILAASRIHTCCVALRRHLAAERLLAQSGHPGTPGCTLTIDQWQSVADRSVKWKESVDRTLATLGLDGREVKSLYDQWLEDVQTEDRRRAQERLSGPPAASMPNDPVLQARNDQPTPPDAAAGQPATGNGNSEETTNEPGEFLS
jgi:hypothetical protein